MKIDMPFKVIIFFLFIFTLIAPVTAQTKAKISCAGKYTIDQGLSGSNVIKIIQDKYGFFWFCTQDGLNRFDGKRFFVYKKSSEKKFQLLGNDVKNIVEDALNDKVWVITSFGGLNAIDSKTGAVVKAVPAAITSGGFNSEALQSLSICNGIIWIGTYNGLCLYNIAQDKLSKFSTDVLDNSYGLQDLSIDYIHVDKFKNVWVFINNYGIIIYSGITLKRTGFINIEQIIKSHEKGSYTFTTVSETNDNLLIVGTVEGVKTIRFGQDEKYVLQGPVSHRYQLNCADELYGAVVDNDNFWYSTKKGLFKFNFNTGDNCSIVDVTDSSESNWLKKCYTIFLTPKKLLVLGSYQGVGIYSVAKPVFAPVWQTPDEKVRYGRIFYPYAESEDSIFCACENGIYTINKNTARSKNIIQGKSFSTVFRVDSKRIIFSGANGTFVYKEHTLIPLNLAFPELADFRKEYIKSIARINDTIVFLGTDANGVYIWNLISRQVQPVSMRNNNAELNSSVVNKVFFAENKKVVILSDNYIMAVDEKGGSKTFYQVANSTGGKVVVLLDFCETVHHYWIAAYGTGVVRLNKNFKTEKIYGELEGLSNTGVYKITPYKDSLILVTSNNGISFIEISTGKIKRYFKYDGLHSDAFEEGCLSGTLNRIYAGGDGGFTLINPGNLEVNKTAPNVFINNVSYLLPLSKSVDTFNLFLQKVIFPNEVIQSTVYFTAQNYQHPNKVNFKYRITEINNDWIDNRNQSYVTLFALPPGTYHFQIKASNEDDQWSVPKEIILVYLPKWYQTWWFKLLVLTAVSGTIYAFYRYRIRQIKKQHEIRRNIATDLHDDLGSTLNSVKVFTNLAISGVEQENSLQQVKDNLEQATAGLRDMIWVLDDSLDTVDELVTRLKQYAIPVANASGITAEIKADFDASKKQLTKDEKRNLFLVCKEAVNNSIKYAGANRIDISIVPEGKKIKIVIADNGKGFDIEKVKKGYGLKNMQYRARQIKFIVSITSTLGKGTQITILPA